MKAKKKYGLGNIEDAKSNVGKSALNAGAMVVGGAVGAVAGTYMGAAGVLVGAASIFTAICTGHSEFASIGVGMAAGGLLTSVSEPTSTKSADGKEKSFIQKFHEKGVARLKKAGATAKTASGIAKLLDKKPAAPAPVVPPVAPQVGVAGINSIMGINSYRKY